MSCLLLQGGWLQKIASLYEGQAQEPIPSYRRTRFSLISVKRQLRSSNTDDEWTEDEFLKGIGNFTKTLSP